MVELRFHTFSALKLTERLKIREKFEGCNYRARYFQEVVTNVYLSILEETETLLKYRFKF